MRMFLPLILLYGAILWGVTAMITHKAIPWTDPRIARIGARLLIYPVILLTLVMLGFAAFSTLIDQGNPGVIFVLPIAAVLFVLAFVQLTFVMVGDVRRIQSTFNKETERED